MLENNGLTLSHLGTILVPYYGTVFLDMLYFRPLWSDFDDSKYAVLVYGLLRVIILSFVLIGYM